MTQEVKTMPVPQLPKVEYPKLELPPTADKGDWSVQRPSSEGVTEVLPSADNSPVPPPAPGVKRILIGVPLLAVSYEFFESFLRFWSELMVTRPPYEVAYCFAYRKPVHMAEEYLVNVAKYNKATHILLMDDDIFDVTRADLDKLIAADKDVIGGVMHASKFPHAMCVFRRFDPSKKVIDMPVDNSMYRLYEVPCTCTNCKVPLASADPRGAWTAKFCPACGAVQDNVIQQADLIPFPFTLIKMDVFDKIKKPWFHCTNTYPTDSWFADRLIEAGMTEYAHMDVRLNHNGVTDESKPHFVQMGMIKARKNNGIVNLTPEQMEIHQHLLMSKMKETEDKQKAKPVFSQGGEIKANSLHEDYTLVTNVGK